MLEVSDLTVAYVTDTGSVVAVDHVNFELGPGEFLGIVGESGCGKSTLLFAIARLLGSPPAARSSAARVCFQGRNMVGLTDEALAASAGATSRS